MNVPIIDPATLTEEQKDAIKSLHKDVVECYLNRSYISLEDWFHILETIFGEEIYKEK